MFHTYISSVYSKCFIYFKRTLHSNVSCFRGMFRESWEHSPSATDRGSEPGAGCQGVWRVWVLQTMACSSSSRLLSPARSKREERGCWEGAWAQRQGWGELHERLDTCTHPNVWALATSIKDPMVPWMLFPFFLVISSLNIAPIGSLDPNGISECLKHLNTHVNHVSFQSSKSQTNMA
jgi:hypothetical protein